MDVGLQPLEVGFYYKIVSNILNWKQDISCTTRCNGKQ